MKCRSFHSSLHLTKTPTKRPSNCSKKKPAVNEDGGLLSCSRSIGLRLGDEFDEGTSVIVVSVASDVCLTDHAH